MRRHMLRRPPADPSTPTTTTPHDLSPRATAPIFETPTGPQTRRDVARPGTGSDTFAGGAGPAWQQQMDLPADAMVPAEEGGEDLDELELEDEPVEGDEEGEEEQEQDDEEEDAEMVDRNRSPSPLPPDLREISSLASWTVSTYKPGCGVAALRHPSPTQYWQSDGPQPHTLTLHFFKRVAIVKLRVYLDFELDESYTPTKMVFLAGMGGNDLVEFQTWEGEAPCGWVDIPLDGVGGRSSSRRKKRKGGRRRSYVLDSSSDLGINESEEDMTDNDSDDPDNPYEGNTLKAMVLQMRICENHQNGKDTHVRGFQVFAHDDDRQRRVHTATRSRRQSMRKSLQGGNREKEDEDGEGNRLHALKEPEWMGEPVIR